MQNTFLSGFFSGIYDAFYKTLVVENRYLDFLSGLRTTIIISIGALIIGVLIGITIAVCKFLNKKFGSLKILNKFFNAYIYLVRGTPVVLQLMIMYFIILSFISNEVVVAIITFGVNSGAYVAEIFRGGLEAVEEGQMEAGRSLGFSIPQTMSHIILPQAFKRALPPMGNEFIALIKETSIVGYVAIVDITKVAQLIQSRTLDAFPPLIISALFYLALVYGLTFILRKIERRLAASDRN